MAFSIELTDSLTATEDLEAAHLRSLVAPLDAMWELAFIRPSSHYLLQDGDRTLGYACIDASPRLLAFHVLDEFVNQGPDAFSFLLEKTEVKEASVGTNDPLFLSLCLERQRRISPNTYLFEDQEPVSWELDGFGPTDFREIVEDDLERIRLFYEQNASFVDESGYLIELIQNRQMFGLWSEEGGELLATGERRFSRSQPPFADIGMIVAEAHRRRGLGAFILTRLKANCYAAKTRPICSCRHDNVGSRKAIQKAGFITKHRIVDVEF